uniref:pantoate--beta-alanine ligase n=1 Tax=Cephaloticoccus sp. TaxID=1985742 RepID=UPI00404B93C2
MQIVETVSEMKQLAAAWRTAGKKVALVPTMGALHAGQEALVKTAAGHSDIVVVAAFVNPLQFAPNEVMSRYPRNPEEDRELCKAAGATVFFCPETAEIYPAGFSTFVSEELLAKPLCGVSRPNHFRGVTTLMTKLFNIVQPGSVFFGQKTAQRAAVVHKMITDLAYQIEVVVVPTKRESDGLAYGIRNRDFSTAQRQEALSIYRALKKVSEMAAAGVRSPDRLVAEATHILGENRKVRVIYVSVVDMRTMEPVREVEPGKCLMMIAVWIDEMRIVDNMLL